MTIHRMMLRLNEIETKIISLIGTQIDSNQKKDYPYAIGPFSLTEFNKIVALLQLLNNELFNEMLFSVIEALRKNGLRSWELNRMISQSANKIQSIVEHAHSAQETWKKILIFRQEVFLQNVSQGLNKEEILNCLSVFQEAKGNILKDIFIVREYLDELNSSLLINKTHSNGVNSEVRCPITSNICDKSVVPNSRCVFVAYQFTSEHYNSNSLKKAIKEALNEVGLEPFFPDEHFEPYHITCEICQKLQEASIGIFEISDSNPNVMFELGIAYMLGRLPILLAKNKSKGTQISDIAGIYRIQYDDLIACRDTIVSFLKDSKSFQQIVCREEVAASL